MGYHAHCHEGQLNAVDGLARRRKKNKSSEKSQSSLQASAPFQTSTMCNHLYAISSMR